ncbi:MAG: hypothetical protein ACFB2Z_14465 [Maricaulaceae bacterium]
MDAVETTVEVPLRGGDETSLFGEVVNQFTAMRSDGATADDTFIMVQTELRGDDLVKRVTLADPSAADHFRTLWRRAQSALAAPASNL